MPSLNEVHLIGHLGQDPEVRYTQSGKAVATISLATSERWGENEQTEWHRVVLWERLAEVAGEYLKKGSLVFVSGRVTYRTWQDPDGQDRHTTEIVARRMLMLDRKSSDQGSGKKRDTGQRDRGPKGPF